jgi:hypothetical protein
MNPPDPPGPQNIISSTSGRLVDGSLGLVREGRLVALEVILRLRRPLFGREGLFGRLRQERPRGTNGKAESGGNYEMRFEDVIGTLLS